MDTADLQDAAPNERATLALSRGLFACALAAVCVLAALVVHHSVMYLLGYVADDAFYYLQVARHVAAGDGSTFDGVNPTNGYQPAWMLVSVVLAFFIHGRIALLKAYLLTEYAFHILSGVLVVRLIARDAPRSWAYVAGAGWLLSPMPLMTAVYGVEAPLYICGLLGVAIALRDLLNDEAPSTVSWVKLGGAAGFALLCRSDAIFPIIGLLFVAIAIANRSVPADEGTPGGSQRITLILTASAACCVVYLPWLIVSWLTDHTFVQDSGAMKTLWKQAKVYGMPASQRLAECVGFMRHQWFGMSLNTLSTGVWQTGVSSWFFGSMILIVVVVSVYLGIGRSTSILMGWLAASLLMTGFAYGYVIGDTQRWHFAQAAIVLYLLFALPLAFIVSVLKGWLQRGVVVLWVVLIAAADVGCVRNLASPTPWQPSVLVSQAAFEKVVPVNEPIGCFNAGIPAYFSNRRIINLDGLVNHSVVSYWEDVRFTDYLADAHIHYIFDEQRSLNRALRFSRGMPKLTVVATAPLPGWFNPTRYLWHVDSLPPPTRRVVKIAASFHHTLNGVANRTKPPPGLRK